MIRVTIGGTSRPLEDVTKTWINKRINKPKAQGMQVCTEVEISESDVNLRLATPSCGGGPGRKRKLTRAEQRVANLWNKRGLNDEDYRGGNVIAFLEQVERNL